ncbi:kinesin-1 [Tieghemostelium lacteum]|uniref:Kinesin-1 n=1 Tax=Tieghemostelium lacteum TaxID=361077 RepID=A0A151ZIH6_TIELA|nr:kinesin-1 [Tieghemostelium lacteum]|eukprot:KYQ93792.1 kinesin-1 [Tieghemostelium lacteum]
MSDELSHSTFSSSQLPPASGVRVVCRFRPVTELEKKKNEHSIVTHHDNTTFSLKLKDGGMQQYSFDRTFNSDEGQSVIYQDVAQPMVKDFFDGYNSTILAYGQTSSGKTYTVYGDPTLVIADSSDDSLESNEVYGIIPRMINEIFSQISKQQGITKSFEVKMSALELYQEKVRDLFNANKKNLQIKQSKQDGDNFYVEGLDQAYILSPQDAFSFINYTNSNRATAATKMSAVSSRSHSIVIIEMLQQNLDTLESKVSKLYLVDLAGSERLSKTGAEGERMKEATTINLSLTELGKVINSLTSGEGGYINYRGSNLTKILKDSLGGTSKTTLIIACSPTNGNEHETISTIAFGNRAKNVKNKPVIHKHETVDELKAQVAKLKEILKDREKFIEQLNQTIKTQEKQIIQLEDENSHLKQSSHFVNTSPIQQPHTPPKQIIHNKNKNISKSQKQEEKVKEIEQEQTKMAGETYELNISENTQPPIPQVQEDIEELQKQPEQMKLEDLQQEDTQSESLSIPDSVVQVEDQKEEEELVIVDTQTQQQVVSQLNPESVVLEPNLSVEQFEEEDEEEELNNATDIQHEDKQETVNIVTETATLDNEDTVIETIDDTTKITETSNETAILDTQNIEDDIVMVDNNSQTSSLEFSDSFKLSSPDFISANAVVLPDTNTSSHIDGHGLTKSTSTLNILDMSNGTIPTVSSLTNDTLLSVPINTFETIGNTSSSSNSMEPKLDNSSSNIKPFTNGDILSPDQTTSTSPYSTPEIPSTPPIVKHQKIENEQQHQQQQPIVNSIIQNTPLVPTLKTDKEVPKVDKKKGFGMGKSVLMVIMVLLFGVFLVSHYNSPLAIGRLPNESLVKNLDILGIKSYYPTLEELKLARTRYQTRINISRNKNLCTSKCDQMETDINQSYELLIDHYSNANVIENLVWSVNRNFFSSGCIQPLTIFSSNHTDINMVIDVQQYENLEQKVSQLQNKLSNMEKSQKVPIPIETTPIPETPKQVDDISLKTIQELKSQLSNLENQVETLKSTNAVKELEITQLQTEISESKQQQHQQQQEFIEKQKEVEKQKEQQKSTETIDEGVKDSVNKDSPSSTDGKKIDNQIANVQNLNYFQRLAVGFNKSWNPIKDKIRNSFDWFWSLFRNNKKQ